MSFLYDKTTYRYKHENLSSNLRVNALRVNANSFLNFLLLNQLHWSGLSGDSGKTSYMNAIAGIFNVTGDPASLHHLVLRIQPEAFGANNCSEQQLIKCIAVNEITPQTMSGALCRILFEGDNSFQAPVKGNSVQIKPDDSPIHAIVLGTSNLPTIEAFREVMKELQGKNTWCSSDWFRNLSETNGRMGVTLRMEEALPLIMRRELPVCPKCSALYIWWCVKRYLLAKGDTITIRKEDVWIHSDSEDEYKPRNDITEWSDFWEAMKMADKDIEKHIKGLTDEMNLSKDQMSTIRMTAEEVALYLKFK